LQQRLNAWLAAQLRAALADCSGSCHTCLRQQLTVGEPTAAATHCLAACTAAHGISNSCLQGSLLQWLTAWQPAQSVPGQPAA